MYEIVNIKKNYVLDGISFQVKKGEIIGILGENGAGKTTLIKSMLKLLTINEGTILFEGMDIKNIPNSKYYRRVASVLEGNCNIYWYLSGYENILYFGKLKKMKTADIRKKADNLLKLFYLYDHKDKQVGEYSRGMQQKLSIILSLLNDPDVLFLDEPTLGLDIKTKKDVMNTLNALSHDKGVTIFITSHQLDVIDELSDRLILLDKGKIVFEGKPSTFKEKYSNDKYRISINANKVDSYLSKYSYELKDNVVNISLDKCTYEQAIQIFSELHNRGYKVISYQKDTYDLEDIMLNFFTKDAKGERKC
ncbi:MAG: ABC transporter domain-containing protein [Lachnoclostridium sp.]